jgi:hypothetical protein
MLEKSVRLMRTYLMKAAVAAGFAPGDVHYEQQGRYFVLDGSSVEVAQGNGAATDKWILREVYDLADLQDGGVRPTVSEVRRYDVGQEMTVAREAAMLAVQKRIDVALEESS